MPKNMDLTLLRAFVAVAESGVITSAANQLHLTQAAVSQQIRRLEEVLDSPLFEREQRGVTLTQTGEIFLKDAKQLLMLNDEIWQKMSGKSISSEVKLGIPYDLASVYLPSLLKKFTLSHPDVTVTLVCLPSDKLISALQQGEVDLTLAEELDPSSDAKIIATESLVWVGENTGAAYQKRPLPIAFGNKMCAFKTPTIHALHKSGIEWKNIMASDSTEALYASIYADFAVTTLLASTVPANLRILESDSGLPVLPTFAITLYLPKAPITDALEALICYLENISK